MKKEILKLLKEQDGHVSGQELCEKFQVSRTAVWKVIRQLQEEGYQIEAVRNKGYLLAEGQDLLNQAELESCCAGLWAGSQVVFRREVASTNALAKQLAEEGAVHGTLVVADGQTAGKGRRGRSWVSPPGQGIWMSLVLRPQVPPSSASMITLVAALAVEEGIRRATGIETKIKWPNDIVANGRKVCGILTEMSAEMEAIHYVVVGIGINVNTENFPEEIRETATSLYLESGKKAGRSSLAGAVMEAMEKYYGAFASRKDLSLLIGPYHARLVNKGQGVKVLDPAGAYEGVALGIGPEGELLVQIQNGTVKKVVSGEVSVRGVYGYA